jgi:regulation of enolase protein 1 (concanavalin A-like superfamily)
MDTVYLRSIPAELRWMRDPVGWQDNGQDSISITAGKETDLFNDPQGDYSIDNSPRLVFDPQGDFTLSARVTVDFRSNYDAGVLLVYAYTNLWAKLCFELSPQKQPMIVSVVTHTLSDDCNSVPIDGDHVYLRIARVKRAFAFHYSMDGAYWHMVRLFSLGQEETFVAGFSAQAPTGVTCTASFSEIAFARRLLDDVRSGE